MKVIDNFLPAEDFDQIKKSVLGINFPWYLQESIDYEGDGKNQLCHIFYWKDTWNSSGQGFLQPITERIQYTSLIKIKSNLLYPTDQIKVNQFHVDLFHPAATTGIFYINTNDGYTEFEDGTIVESVENRYVEFDTITKHRGTTSTNINPRVLINFNYFK